MVPGMNQLLIRLPGLDGLAAIQPVAATGFSFAANLVHSIWNMSSGVSLKFSLCLLIQEFSLSQKKDSW